MNILPFVLIFILAIAGYSTSFIHKSQSALYQTKLYTGHLYAQWDARNRLQDYLFENKKRRKNNEANTKTSQNGQNPTPAKKTPKHPRLSYVKTEKSKINIYPLFLETNFKNTPLYQFSIQLLRHLYQNTSCYYSGLECDLLDNMIRNAKKQMKKGNHELSIFDLYPENETQAKHFYKIARGTKYYDLQGTGIPSFLDFFTLCSNEKRKPLYFSYIDKEILHVLFGAKIGQIIWDTEYEKKKNHPKSKKATLKKNEVEEIIQKNSGSKIFSSWEQLCSFSSYPNNLPLNTTIEGSDPSTSIRVRNKIY
ncbi:MAG: hypothetical protein Tsb0015_14600 [Simkaniaceae bacterium]